jgi:hypothetical protein
MEHDSAKVLKASQRGAITAAGPVDGEREFPVLPYFCCGPVRFIRIAEYSTMRTMAGMPFSSLCLTAGYSAAA